MTSHVSCHDNGPTTFGKDAPLQTLKLSVTSWTPHAHPVTPKPPSALRTRCVAEFRAQAEELLVRHLAVLDEVQADRSVVR